MCGINGILLAKKEIEMSGDLLSEMINRMNDDIIHRGPDDDGMFTVGDTLALGMRRLSIIDVEHGHQPLFNDDRSLVIVYNGEVYNFLELKKILLDKGYSFVTSSDTEVILKLYECFGPSCVNYLNGMFAFSIYDKKSNSIFIARDRLGEKPLYYAKQEGKVVWASELKSIVNLFPDLKEISLEALQLFLSLSYIPAPHTIYQDIYKLEPGCTMMIDTDSLAVDIEKYWNIEVNSMVQKSSYNDATKELQRLLYDSVEKRMIADVPIGVFLSGGVDSTIVASIMSSLTDQRIKTFTIGYKNKRYDESVRANIVARHINSEHHEYLLDAEEVIGDIDKVILNYDEPYADSSCLPTYFISRKTADFVKVALTGDGGDEVFGGYNKYLLHTYGKLYQQLVPPFISKNIIEPFLHFLAPPNADTKSFITRSRKLFDSIGGDPISNHLNIIQLGFKADDLNKIWSGKHIVNVNQILEKIIFPIPTNLKSSLKIARYIDAKISLEGDLLVKVDRASMLTSLEGRAPFLDHRLMEFSYGLPDSYLIKGNNMKRILKDSFKHLLPVNFVNAPKSGFEVPIGAWFRNELKSDLLQTLSERNLNHHNFFNHEYILELIEEHQSGKIDHSGRLWTLYCFQKWYNKNLL